MALLQLTPTHKLTSNATVSSPLPSLNPIPNSILPTNSLLHPRSRRPGASLKCRASASFPERHRHSPRPIPDDVVSSLSSPPTRPLPRRHSPPADLLVTVPYHDAHPNRDRPSLWDDLYQAGTAHFGCVGEVIRHERLVDHRFFLITKLVRTKPYFIAEVTWLEEWPTGEDDVEALAADVDSYMKDVIRLSNQLYGKPGKEEAQDLRRNSFPTPFSFFVGNTFEGSPREQQVPLE